MEFANLQHLVDYIEQASLEQSFSYQLAIITNGTLLDQDKAEYLLAKNIKIVLSLDGSQASNDLNRQEAQTANSVFAKVMGNLQTLDKNLGLFKKIEIAKVISPNNYQFLAADLAFFQQAGFASLDVQLALYQDWSRINLSDWQIKVKDFFQAYEQFFINNDKQPVIKLNNFYSLFNAENHRLSNCEKYRLDSQGSLFLCLSYLLDAKKLEAERLDQTADFAKNKLALIKSYEEAIGNQIKLSEACFCPLDLFVYCQEKNLNFIETYNLYQQLLSIFNEEMKACADRLYANAQFRKMFNL